MIRLVSRCIERFWALVAGDIVKVGLVDKEKANTNSWQFVGLHVYSSM